MASPHPRHALLLLAALAALPAAALDPAQHGGGAACLAGDCDNGEGTIRSDDGNEYTGIWSGGRFTDGRTYRVRYGFEPSRTTELVFNAQGKPVSGTLLRGNPHTGSGTVGTFTGTFSARSTSCRATTSPAPVASCAICQLASACVPIPALPPQCSDRPCADVLRAQCDFVLRREHD